MEHPIAIDDALKAFIESGVSVVVGTRDDGLVPEIVRAWGPQVSRDRRRVRLCVPEATSVRSRTNLVANALKFSPPQREVLVEARADADALRIEVTDQGSGIPAAALPHIFEKFYRVPAANEEGAPGTGLGLAFVRECAEQHGGRVTVTSEEGVGSTFTLWLPLEGKL